MIFIMFEILLQNISVLFTKKLCKCIIYFLSKYKRKFTGADELARYRYLEAFVFPEMRGFRGGTVCWLGELMRGRDGHGTAW